MNLLEDPFIQTLTLELNQPGVIGIAIAGSYSRGEQDPHSDEDVDIFVNTLPDNAYTLRIMDGKLVSLKYISLQDEFDSLKKPEGAIWAVMGLRQMQILLDESGQLAELKQAAYDFKWDDLQEAADKFAVENLMGCAEEAHKVVGGLLQGNESKVLYASWGMFKDLLFAAAVQAGLMIESENHIFAMLQDHFSANLAWTRAFRLSFGMDIGDASLPVYQTRGLAVLDLYEQTALLFEHIIDDKHREVIAYTRQLISSYKQGYPHE